MFNAQKPGAEEEGGTGSDRPDFDVRVRDREVVGGKISRVRRRQKDGRALMMMARGARVPHSACGCIAHKAPGTPIGERVSASWLYGSRRHDGLEARKCA